MLLADPLWKAYLALTAVCIFWGTTYLAIRMALEAFSPAVLVSTRFLISGFILLAIGLARGVRFPPAGALWITALCGFLILGIGNGAVTLAELLIPSGLTGLIVTISPFWLVGLEAALGGERLHMPAIAGMLVGLCGAAMLLTPSNPEAWASAGFGLGANTIQGFLLLQVGMASWSFGSLVQRRQPLRLHPVMVGAVQQIAAGLSFIPLALATHSKPVDWGSRGVLAMLYLVMFGSIVGYSAYVYAMDRLPVAVVSIYPYVNAVVAVALGWLFYSEPFGTREALAMAIIFAGVGLVKWHSRHLTAMPGKRSESASESVLLENFRAQRAARGTDHGHEDEHKE
ncbi:MAG: EamA family transporter [Bryobacteraceae bacterium]